MSCWRGVKDAQRARQPLKACSPNKDGFGVRWLQRNLSRSPRNSEGDSEPLRFASESFLGNSSRSMKSKIMAGHPASATRSQDRMIGRRHASCPQSEPDRICVRAS
jgi:hypothetical protein